MPPAVGPTRLGALLAGSLRDGNFRRLLRFIAELAIRRSSATPFFTVFIVRQLHFNVNFAMVPSVVSQIANVLALRVCGTLSDRFVDKIGAGDLRAGVHPRDDRRLAVRGLAAGAAPVGFLLPHRRYRWALCYHRLPLSEGHGEIKRREMGEVLSETHRTIRNISSVAGLRAAAELPGALLREARLRRAQQAKLSHTRNG